MTVTDVQTADRTVTPPVMSNKKFGGRLAFIDFTRGLAATIMLQGHVFHSMARSDVREGGPYTLSQFLGGLAPAVFLFLTGVTLAFLMNGLEKKGLDAKARVGAALRRAGYLATIAILFRVQLWAFSWPYGQWTDLLKVDETTVGKVLASASGGGPTKDSPASVQVRAKSALSERNP